jgi:exosortase C (VPDSG-CTERM-specific)
MQNPHEIIPPPAEATMRPAAAPPASAALRNFFTAGVALLAVFSYPLWQTARFALGSELYSHILLIPFVSGYFAWLERDKLRGPGTSVHPGWALGLLGVGGGLSAWYLLLLFSPGRTVGQDVLVLALYAFALLLAGLACLFLPRATVRAWVFPLGLLVFLAPFPVAVEHGLESFLQYNSARVAQALFQLAGMPVFRDETYFRLPGFSLEVAPECSGIHSTLALFITSIVGGRLLLRRRWTRVTLALSVLPIALLRNGFRIVVVGELCVRIGPHMINSYIHRHGGPIFFVLSLVPFSLLLFFLLKADRRRLEAKT